MFKLIKTCPSASLGRHNISFGRGHRRCPYIITNLLELQAISWKQTGQTEAALKPWETQGRGGSPVALDYCSAPSKASQWPEPRESPPLLRCNAYTVDKLGWLFFRWFGLQGESPQNNGVVGGTFTWTLYAMCSLVTLGLKSHYGSPASSSGRRGKPSQSAHEEGSAPSERSLVHHRETIRRADEILHLFTGRDDFLW